MGDVKTTLRLPDHVHAALVKEAARELRSLNNLIASLLAKHVAESGARVGENHEEPSS